MPFKSRDYPYIDNLVMLNPSFITDEVYLGSHGKQDETTKKERTFSFEDTVAELGTGRFHLFIMLICGSSFLSSVNEGLSLGFVLPYVKCDLQMTPTEQGLLNSVGFCGIILSSHFWGFMADTWGRKKVMQVSVITTFVFSAMSSVASNVWLMITLRFVVGLCISGVQSSGIAYLGEFHSDRTRSKHVTFTAMFSTLSILYMSSIGWLIIPATWETTVFGMVYRPWRFFILSSSCINLFAFCGLLAMPESPKFMLAMGKKQEALDIIKNVYQMNTGNPKETFPVQEIEPEKLGSNLSDAHGALAVLRMMWAQTKPLFMPPYVMNLVRMSYLSFCLFAVAHGIYMWYPEILNIYYRNTDVPNTLCGNMALESTKTNVTNSMDECVVTNSSTTYPIFLTMGTVFVILYIFAAMNMQHRRVLLSSWMLMTAGVGIGLVFVDNFYVIQAFVILVCTSGNCGTILTAVSADLFPTRYKGMALCLIMISARFGSVLGNNIIAALLMNNCDSIFYGCFALLASCVIVFLTISTKPKSNG